MASTQLSEVKGAESADLFKVLSSDARRGILKLLQHSPSSLGDLAGALAMSRSTLSRHVQSLCDVGLVIVDGEDGARGSQRICRLRYDRVAVSFEGPPAVRESIDETEMPLGLYSRVEAAPPCGLASATGIIGSYDDPQAFLVPERATAQFLWNGRGFVEYAFPNRLPPGTEILRLELTMEIGSEIALHRMDAASDITVWINGTEIGTWTSLGGLGDKRGRLTPAWWWDTRTQYGMLKVWSVDTDGSSIDGFPLSSRTIRDLALAPQKPILLRIGVKQDAANGAGFNIFGKGFGNYEHDLVLRLHYLEPVPPNGDDAEERQAGGTARR